MFEKMTLTITRSMTGITLSIPGAIVNATHLDGSQEVNSHPANGVGILYPGERVDFTLEWPDNQQELESNLIITLDKEYVRGRSTHMTNLEVK